MRKVENYSKIILKKNQSEENYVEKKTLEENVGKSWKFFEWKFPSQIMKVWHLTGKIGKIVAKLENEWKRARMNSRKRVEENSRSKWECEKK